MPEYRSVRDQDVVVITIIIKIMNISNFYSIWINITM